MAPEELLTKTRERASSDTLLTLDREGTDIVVVGRIEPRGEGFRTELRLRDALGRSLGERTFDSPARSCRALDESLILALVLLVETPPVRAAARGESMEVLAEAPPPLEAEEHPDVRIAPQPRARARTSPPPQPRRRPWTFELGVGASAAGGFAPRPTLGPTLSATVRPPAFVPVVLRAAAYAFAVDRVTVPGEGISVRGFVGGIELCPLGLARDAIEGRLCGGAHAAGLQAHPLGPRSRPGDVFFVVLPVRAELRVRARTLEPYAAMTVRFSPMSPTFVYRVPGGGERTSFSAPWATIELDLGIAWRLLP
ncbi:MAG: hypothetical protein K0S65_5413 [Labilithrix sp.]|nr:hypothetical protein [Labilithrix sp.]